MVVLDMCVFCFFLHWIVNIDYNTVSFGATVLGSASRIYGLSLLSLVHIIVVMANLRPFRHENFLSFFDAKSTTLRSAPKYAFCSLQDVGFTQIEMDPIVKELSA